jgi:hemerythrin-like domain-containing protein
MSTLMDPRADLIPELRPYAAMHDAIVRDCHRLVPAIESLRTGAEAHAIATWFARFEMVITHHHEREDDVVFPLLSREVRDFDGRDLGDEHLELDRLMEAVGVGLAAARRSATRTTRPSDASLRDAASAAGELAELMNRHIAVEERVVFPLIAAHISPDDWATAEREIQKGTSIRAMTFTLPWVLDDADPGYGGHILDDVPFVFRAVNSLWWERSYRRVAAPVRGVAS